MEATAVEYRLVPGFRDYRVGSDGSVWSRVRTAWWRRLRPSGNGHRGYLYVTLRGPVGPRRVAVHTLVALAFLGPRPSGQEVRHRNGVRADNQPGNLRYGTRADNMRDAREHGTLRRGSRVAGAKLTERRVALMRTRRAAGDRLAELARRFGVTEATVCDVCSGRSWRHVPLTA